MADETESKQKFVIKEDDIKVFKILKAFIIYQSYFATPFGESQVDQHTAQFRTPGYPDIS